MNKADWKDTAELIGIAAIVASLTFVGLELRQSQRIAYAEQEGAQIADYMAIDELIASKAALVLKLNREEDLTDTERIEAQRLILSVEVMSFFTNNRAFYLGHPGVGAPVQGFAMLLFQNPGLRSLWVSMTKENSELRKVLAEETERVGAGRFADFRENVAKYLEVLDRIE